MTDETTTPQPGDDDTEGHMPRIRGYMDTEAATEDDTEGHVNFIDPEGPEDSA